MVMKTVSVASFKSHLRHFLELAKHGEEVVITSHRHPVGKLVPHVQREKLRILSARRPFSALWKLKGVKPLRPVNVVALLREDRDRR